MICYRIFVEQETGYQTILSGSQFRQNKAGYHRLRFSFSNRVHANECLFGLDFRILQHFEVSGACSSARLERTPDKREVGSSSLPRPTMLFQLGDGSFSCVARLRRGRSSVGRAVALQASGRRFDPVRLHQRPAQQRAGSGR